MIPYIKGILETLSGKAGYLVFALVVLYGVYLLHQTEIKALKSEMQELVKEMIEHQKETELLLQNSCEYP